MPKITTDTIAIKMNAQLIGRVKKMLKLPSEMTMARRKFFFSQRSKHDAQQNRHQLEAHAPQEVRNDTEKIKMI